MLAQGGLVEAHRFTIKARFGKPIYILPFGDIHYGDPLCAKDEFRDFINWNKDAEDIYYLGMGDYMDAERASLRAEIQALKAKFGDETIVEFDNAIAALTERFYKEIGHVKGKCIGMLEGNHHHTYTGGETTTMHLCRLLGTKYLGCTAFVRVVIDCGGSQCNVDFFANHGQGGSARLKGGSLNRVQYMAEGVEADIYMMGHDHQLGAMPDTKIYPQWNSKTRQLEVKQKRKLYVRTGSFLRGYMPGHVSYIADKCKKPTDLGGMKIILTPQRKKIDGKKQPMQIKMETQC